MKQQAGPEFRGDPAVAEAAPLNLDTLIERMAFLKKVPLFSELGVAELGLIARIAAEEKYPDEAVLIEEGQSNQKLYIIVQGFVELSARLSGEQHGSLGIVGAANCVGEDGIFNNSPSPVCAQVAMGEARMFTMNGGDLQRLIRLYPEIGIGLLASLSRRVQKLQRMMIQLEK
jgi:CRP-like cAMP-binding protein